jgi:hypothetical protein
MYYNTNLNLHSSILDFSEEREGDVWGTEALLWCDSRDIISVSLVGLDHISY